MTDMTIRTMRFPPVSLRGLSQRPGDPDGKMSHVFSGKERLYRPLPGDGLARPAGNSLPEGVYAGGT
jgi:hypothetical protein